MADDWDTDDFVPAAPVLAKETTKTQWEDEDKEEGVQESWEDDSKPNDQKTAKEGGDQPKGKGKAASVGGKAKGEKKDAEASTSAASEVLADPVAEKLRQQRLVEESDYRATRELFGGKEQARKLEDFIPKTEAEFDEYANLVADQLTPFAKSFHYVSMLKVVLRKSTSMLSAADTKEISAAATVISNEKLKAEKDLTAGKKKTAAKKQQLKLKSEEDDYRGGAYTDAVADEYDFM